MDVFGILRNSYFTHGLSDDEVKKIAAISQVCAFSNNDEVIREFDPACDVFIIVEGKALVTTSNGDMIARPKVGAIVGEIGLFSQESRTATVLSDGDSKMIKVCGDDLNALFDREPAIGVKVLRNVGRTLCEHLRSSNIQLETVLNAL